MSGGTGSLPDFLARLDGERQPTRTPRQAERDADLARQRALTEYVEREGFQPTGVPGVWRKLRRGDVGPRA